MENIETKQQMVAPPQFYRFDKLEDDYFPKMIELFCRSDFKLKNAKGITPIHIDDEVSSLSAILLNDDYYKALLNGKEVRKGLSVLRPEYIILFKVKAYLDLKERKDSGEKVDSSDIKKHKKDVLRIDSELILEKNRRFYTFCGITYAITHQLMPKSKNLQRLTKPEIPRKTRKYEVMQQ